MSRIAIGKKKKKVQSQEPSLYRDTQSPYRRTHFKSIFHQFIKKTSRASHVR